MLGILARAMMAVTARLSPELVGPQMACTFSWLIISWVAFTALVGSPWVSRVMISILRPLTPPAALIASAANITPRLKPIAGAELGPVKAASQPMRMGSDAAMAGLARPNTEAVARPVPPNTSPRRLMFMVPPDSSDFVRFRRYPGADSYFSRCRM